MPFSFEEWCVHKYGKVRSEKILESYYERDLEIGRTLLNEGLEGAIKLLKECPQHMGDTASIIVNIYELLKKKGLV